MLETASLAGLGAAILPAAASAQQKEPPPNYPAAKDQPQGYQVGKDPGKHEPLPDFKFDIESTTGMEAAVVPKSWLLSVKIRVGVARAF